MRVEELIESLEKFKIDYGDCDVKFCTEVDFIEKEWHVCGVIPVNVGTSEKTRWKCYLL